LSSQYRINRRKFYRLACDNSVKIMESFDVVGDFAPWVLCSCSFSSATVNMVFNSWCYNA